MSKCLIKFNEYGPGMGFPSMKASFENAPYSGIDRIIAYLENGKKTYTATSKARDFFTGDIIQEENCGMTDGEFSWNGSLIYYVKKYNLRLLKEFEDYVLAK